MFRGSGDLGPAKGQASPRQCRALVETQYLQAPVSGGRPSQHLTGAGNIQVRPADDGQLTIDGEIRAQKSKVDESEVTDNFDDHVVSVSVQYDFEPIGVW